MIPKRKKQNQYQASSPEQSKKQIAGIRCFYCGYVGNLVWVHGHGQCPYCKTNVDECCRGEN